MNVKQAYEFGMHVFDKKKLLNSLHQEIADNFYPERANFTLGRDLSDEFAEHLMTSYPVLVRRELGDQIGAMLRPFGEWFSMVPSNPKRDDDESKRWLEDAVNTLRRAIDDPAAMFTRATKEADHDFATFGQAVISAELIFDNPAVEGPHLLHRTWHLRDMAWVENEYGQIGSRFRKWKPSARELFRLFGNKVHEKVEAKAKGPGKKPLEEIDVMHMILEADLYDLDAKGNPFVSVFYDHQNKHIMQEVATFSSYYIIPRWQTVSGSQYAYSPATIVGLPDARLIQAMTRTLLEVGEKIANPPMVATDEVIRTDIGIYPGGITYVDRDYDERLGEALRPLTLDSRGIPIGQDLLQDSRELIWNIFYLNKLALPERGPEMTAFEVGQRVQEYVRGALPVFQPMENEYSGQLLEQDFELLRRGGAFGSPRDMPQSLQGADVSFRFASPLHDAIEQQKAQKFLEMRALLSEAVQMDRTAIALPDTITAFRDALHASKIPSKWIRTETTVAQMKAAEEAQQQAQAQLDSQEQGSEVTKNLASAAKDLSPEGSQAQA